MDLRFRRFFLIFFFSFQVSAIELGEADASLSLEGGEDRVVRMMEDLMVDLLMMMMEYQPNDFEGSRLLVIGGWWQGNGGSGSVVNDEVPGNALGVSGVLPGAGGRRWGGPVCGDDEVPGSVLGDPAVVVDVVGGLGDWCSFLCTGTFLLLIWLRNISGMFWRCCFGTNFGFFSFRLMILFFLLFLCSVSSSVLFLFLDVDWWVLGGSWVGG